MPFRFFPRILLLVLLSCLARVALAQDFLALPGMKKEMALDYPDKTQLSVTSSGFEYTLSISGKHVKRDGDRTVTNQAQIVAKATSIRASKGLQYTDRITGQLVSRCVDDDEVSVSTTPFTYQHSVNSPGKEEGSKPVTISKKLGVAHFSAPTWKIVNFPTATNLVYKNQQGTFTDKLEQEACFDIRIPDLASTSTAFAAAVAEIERQGHDARLPLSGNVGPATFEAPWKGPSAHGTFTVKIEALVTPGWINVNTPEANKYLQGMSGKEVENPLADTTFSGTLTITWWLGARPPQSRLVLEPDDETAYGDWLPTPQPEGGVDFSTPGYNPEPLEVKARLEPATEKEVQPSGRLDFYLTDVSTNRGRCCNFPKSFAEDDDLRFATTQSDPNVQLDPANPRHAFTTKPVEQAAVTIEALDTGAYGKLEVRCDDLSLVGEYKPTGKQYLALPRDDDENNVADIWEKRVVGGEAHPADWDEDPQPAGQATTGDGISLYREYRGFCIIGEDGHKRFVRLDPRRKNMFVIDAGGVFDLSAWGVVSEILAYKVDDSLVRGGGDPISSRIVDHTMSEGPNVYAVRVETVKGLADPGGEEGETVGGYTTPWPLSSPREVTRCVVFPDRHRKFIRGIVGYLKRAVANPQGNEGQALQQAGMPPHLWQDALDRLDAATQEQLAQQCLRSTTIHEVGHACGIPGHVNPDSGEEGSTGDKNCPMRYNATEDDLRFIVLQTIFKPGATLQGTFSRFCKQDDNCWSHLSLR
ncbi:MAG: hypothetical protein ABFE07_14125 [Armatimonadia bacterium]